VGCVGYVAVMECRSVHEERPRASTSGGQSEGRDGTTVDVGGAVVVSMALAVDLGLLPVMANHEATSVQVRHLWSIHQLLERHSGI